MANATDTRIDEILAQKGIDETLDYIQETLKTTKKTNIADLEHLIIKEIDLSVRYLNRRHIKDDLSYYRNIMQYENGKSLEKVLKYFRDSIEARFNQIKEDVGQQVQIEDVETGFIAEDLMLLAFQTEEQLDNQDKLGPCIKFMIEGYEIILDVLRSNSSMFQLYNTTAEHCMDFCVENNRKREFRKITDTLSKHLKNILTQKPEAIKNIPHPIYIEDNEAFEYLLNLRTKALEHTLHLDNWSDSLKIIKDIRDLDKYRKSKGFNGLKPSQRALFLQSIAELFKKAKFYLFYAGSLCSADKKWRNWNKRPDQHKAEYADKIILAYLMIPLNESATNFKPIGFNILRDSGNSKTKEFSTYCDLIDQPKKDLNRGYIYRWIINSNLLTICSEEVKNLYNIMESQAVKPATLSATARSALDWISKHEEYKTFSTQLRSNLILRILEHLGKVFKVLKFPTFTSLFPFLSFNEVERSITEGNRTYISSQTTHNTYSKSLLSTSISTIERNRQRLFHIKIDPEAQNFHFDSYKANELAKKRLAVFTTEMTNLDLMINSNKVLGKKEISEMTTKLTEKLGLETGDAQERYQQSLDEKERKREADEEQKRKEIAEANLSAEERQRKLEEEQYFHERKMLVENVMTERADYLRSKVREMQENLRLEGVKAVGNVQLKDVWKISEDVDVVYNTVKKCIDEVVSRKQEEASIYANKLINETDLTERAMRIFERPMLEEELKRRNETEIADLKTTLLKKHENDVNMKKLLISSQDSKAIYLDSEMAIRRTELEVKKEEFMRKKTEEIKNKILSNAKQLLRREENKKLAEKRAQELKERDRRLRAQNGLPDAPSRPAGEDTGFSRKGFGTDKPVEVPRDDSKYQKREDRKPRKPRTKEDFGGFKRDMFGKGEKETPEERKERGPPRFGGQSSGTSDSRPSGPPRFSGTKKSDEGGWRSNKPTEKDEEKKETKPKKVVRKKKPKKAKDAGVGRFDNNW